MTTGCSLRALSVKLLYLHSYVAVAEQAVVRSTSVTSCGGAASSTSMRRTSVYDDTFGSAWKPP